MPRPRVEPYTSGAGGERRIRYATSAADNPAKDWLYNTSHMRSSSQTHGCVCVYVSNRYSKQYFYSLKFNIASWPCMFSE